MIYISYYIKCACITPRPRGAIKLKSGLHLVRDKEASQKRKKKSVGEPPPGASERKTDVPGGSSKREPNCPRSVEVENIPPGHPSEERKAPS